LHVTSLWCLKKDFILNGEIIIDWDWIFLWFHKKRRQHWIWGNSYKIRVIHEVLGFYDLDDLRYVCTLYSGDNYFRFVVGNLTSALPYYPLSSLRFFQGFRVKFIPLRIWSFKPFFFIIGSVHVCIQLLMFVSFWFFWASIDNFARSLSNILWTWTFVS